MLFDDFWMTSDDFVFLIPGINLFFVLCGNSESVSMKKCHAMNIQEAKKIRLVDFLRRTGASPGHTTQEQCVVQVSFPDGKGGFLQD